MAAVFDIVCMADRCELLDGAAEQGPELLLNILSLQQQENALNLFLFILNCL